MTQEHMTITLKTPGQNAPSPAPSPNPAKRTRRWWRRFFSLAIGLVVLGLVAGGLFYIYRVIGARSAPAAASSVANEASGGDESAQMVAKVAKLMLLPSETPTVAVVSDLAKLQGQAFFAHAQVGDVVLMYAQAQKAILYSPSENKIIEVAPIVNNQPASQ